MARGGINKTLVLQARQELLRKGINPSVDATRVQLGNTGSKTTILRYLKEIDKDEGTTIDDKALLNNTLKKMIAQLASQLQNDAKAIIEKNDEAYQSKIKQLTDEEKIFKKQLTQADNHYQSLDNKRQKQKILLAQQSEKNQTLQIEISEFHEKVTQLTQRLHDKDEHIASLEEKHTHSRDALEHYRHSVKEQRQQDLRLHEQQLQQLQVEQRHLNQTLIVKQDVITQLNTDNSRLVTEMKNVQKDNDRMIKEQTHTEKQLQFTQTEMITLNNEKAVLMTQSTVMNGTIQSLSEQIQSKESQWTILNDKMNQQISQNIQLEQDIMTAKVALKARNDIVEEIQNSFKKRSQIK